MPKSSAKPIMNRSNNYLAGHRKATATFCLKCDKWHTTHRAAEGKEACA